MKLWKCDPYMADNKGFVTVVVMAETRQQAIEKASAELSAKLPGVLGQMFGEDDDRRCAEKYGPLWNAYRERVRWRIVPFIY